MTPPTTTPKFVNGVLKHCSIKYFENQDDVCHMFMTEQLAIFWEDKWAAAVAAAISDYLPAVWTRSSWVQDIKHLVGYQPPAGERRQCSGSPVCGCWTRLGCLEVPHAG
jgi:hypothetical protein